MASALNFRRLYNGIKIIAKSAATSVGLGEFEVLSSTNKATFHNGTSASPIVTEEHTATLYNKSINAVDNTLSGITTTSLSATANVAITQLAQIPTGKIITSDDGATNIYKTPAWVNADIATGANIAVDKLAPASPGQILMGTTGSGVITPTTVGGKLVATGAGTFAFNPSNLIVDADIDPAADILRTKLLIGTPNVILANDGSGIMSETIITVADLTTSSGDSTLTSVSLPDNTLTTFYSVAKATIDTMHICYSIKRSTTYEAGRLTLITDGTNVSLAQGSVATIGDTGTTITASISGALVIVKAQTTSTGSAATIKFKNAQWLS